MSFIKKLFKTEPANLTFIEQQPYEEGFAEHFNVHIRPKYDEAERERIINLNKIQKRLFITLPLGAVGAVLAWEYAPKLEDPGDGFSIYFAFLVFLAMWNAWPAFVYKKAIKELIYDDIFRFFGDGFQFSPESGISMERLKPSGIIPSHNRYRKEDHTQGTYHEVGLELSEARLVRGSGKNKRTVFRGVFILLEMNKDFEGHTIVMKDQGVIGNWVRDKFDKKERVTLEDPVFEDKFEVYSTDQVEARYLLTTSFMERLLQLAALFGDARLQCAFYENKLLIMLPQRKNLFEPGNIFRPALHVDDIHRLLQEFHLIFSIIDVLKLNMRIGL